MRSKVDPHLRPQEFKCCGKCKTEQEYNGVDYNRNCTCLADCDIPDNILNLLQDTSEPFIDLWPNGD